MEESRQGNALDLLVGGRQELTRGARHARDAAISRRHDEGQYGIRRTRRRRLDRERHGRGQKLWRNGFSMNAQTSDASASNRRSADEKPVITIVLVRGCTARTCRRRGTHEDLVVEQPVGDDHVRRRGGPDDRIAGGRRRRDGVAVTCEKPGEFLAVADLVVDYEDASVISGLCLHRSSLSRPSVHVSFQ